MHNAISAACRRTAGVTAGLLLGAGLAGGIVLTPGTALAGTAVATTTAITGTTQPPGHRGPALDVRVSVTPASGTGWPSGTVTVSDGRAGCQLTLVQDGSTAVGIGDCTIYGLRSGTHTLTASYAGSSSFAASASAPDPVTIGDPPVRPHPVIATQLSCPSKVHSGKQGTCTLSVTDASRFSAPDVTAQVSLPSQLRALYCGRFWSRPGCTISANTVSETLGPLRPGQTRSLSVIFAAKSSQGIWGWLRHHLVKVKVAGSAVEPGFPGPGSRSFAAAYVTIVPPGWWRAS
jgi:Big-like domain-containing protein